MSFFTPSDAAYIKGSVRKIMGLMATVGIGEASDEELHEAESEIIDEHARLEAFIDGTTLTGKGQ